MSSFDTLWGIAYNVGVAAGLWIGVAYIALGAPWWALALLASVFTSVAGRRLGLL